MPGVLQALLGHEEVLSTGGTTRTFATTGAAAAGTKLIGALHWWDNPLNLGTAVITSVTDNDGGTWTVAQGVHTNTNDNIAFVYRDAPTGLASGKIISVTFNVVPDGGFEHSYASFTGLRTGAALSVGSIISTSGTNINTGAVIPGLDGFVVGAIGLECAATETATWTTGTKLTDNWLSTTQQALTWAYLNPTTTDAVTPAGTISSTSTASVGLSLVFQSINAIPFSGNDFPDFTEFGPSSDFGPSPFLADPFPDVITISSGNVTFSMGTTQAILTLTGLVPQGLARVAPGAATMNFAGIVPTERVIVKPPVALFTLSGIVYTKLTVRFTVSTQAIMNFVANVGTIPSTPVVFNMGTTQAIMNLNGIVPTKLRVLANSLQATITLSALAPKEIERVFPPLASLQIRSTVPTLRLVQSVPIGSLTLSAQVPQRPIVRVFPTTAILRLVSQAPIDPTSNPNKPQKIRALGQANMSDSKDSISR